MLSTNAQLQSASRQAFNFYSALYQGPTEMACFIYRAQLPPFRNLSTRVKQKVSRRYKKWSIKSNRKKHEKLQCRKHLEGGVSIMLILLNAILDSLKRGFENMKTVSTHLFPSFDADSRTPWFLTFNLTNCHLYTSFTPFADIILWVIVGQDSIIQNKPSRLPTCGGQKSKQVNKLFLHHKKTGFSHATLIRDSQKQSHNEIFNGQHLPKMSCDLWLDKKGLFLF